jgi:hypothetical protein
VDGRLVGRSGNLLPGAVRPAFAFSGVARPGLAVLFSGLSVAFLAECTAGTSLGVDEV